MTAQITEADINKVVRAFYADVRRDDLLGPVFATKIHDEDWESHMLHIADFWSSIFLKTGRYNGNPMQKHASLSQITPEHFRRWLSLFAQTLNDTVTPEQASKFYAMAERIGSSLQMGLAFQYEKAGVKDHPFTDFGLRRSKLG